MKFIICDNICTLFRESEMLRIILLLMVKYLYSSRYIATYIAWRTQVTTRLLNDRQHIAFAPKIKKCGALGTRGDRKGNGPLFYSSRNSLLKVISKIESSVQLIKKRISEHLIAFI